MTAVLTENGRLSFNGFKLHVGNEQQRARKP
jgi:hypothetical protein